MAASRVIAPAPHLALVPAAETVAEPDHQYATPQEAFCARLKAARERRGISLAEVGDLTKVATSLFQSLERGDLSRWPKGLYRRSFFRGYATAVGLPTDPVLQEFLRLFPDEEQAAGEPADKPEDAQDAQDIPAAFRLTLAAGKRRALPFTGVARHTWIDASTVVTLTALLVWTTEVNVVTGTAILGLCYYPALASMVRRYRTRVL